MELIHYYCPDCNWHWCGTTLCPKCAAPGKSHPHVHCLQCGGELTGVGNVCLDCEADFHWSPADQERRSE